MIISTLTILLVIALHLFPRRIREKDQVSHKMGHFLYIFVTSTRKYP